MSKLTMIGLPIGNKDDISIRSLEALKRIRYIIAEDTRSIRKLLDVLEIDYSSKSFYAFHDHNQNAVQEMTNLTLEHEEVGIVSDAGSPIISDPALPLIINCLQNDVEIDTCPGATSIITALELSGLPAQPFHFYGFSPREKAKRLSFLKEINTNYGTHIFFESPHRVKEALKQYADVFGDAQMAIARELTKMFQSVYRGTANELFEKSEDMKIKGEFVILVRVENKTTSGNISDLQDLARTYLEKQSGKNLSKLLAKILDDSSKDIYSKITKKSD